MTRTGNHSIIPDADGVIREPLSRFLRGAPAEMIGTVLNGISNFLLPEIDEARDQELEHLGFLETHAVIQVVTEKLVGLEKPIDGTWFYIRTSPMIEPPSDRRQPPST